MPQLDFYVLAGTDPTARRLYVCRLTEKAWKNGHRVFIRVPDATVAALLDDLLWTFRQGSFIPHALDSNHADVQLTPILIGMNSAPEGFHDFLINLSNDIPEDWLRFQRIVEIVDTDANIRQTGREKYRAYQKQGIKPVVHRIP